jgi:hypothetical protein
MHININFIISCILYAIEYKTGNNNYTQLHIIFQNNSVVIWLRRH